MTELPLGVIFGILALLILLSGFFSSSETGLMALNRYRLRHLAKENHRGARLAQNLLAKPDRLVGLILLGNNLVNILASALATVAAIRLFGEQGILIATATLTVVILIFAEVAPKTVAALNPEKIAFPASYVLTPLLRVLWPIVWLVNLLANGVLRILGQATDLTGETLSREELRTIVSEGSALIPRRHQNMLVNILDLESATVEDIMVPRSDIVGIDLGGGWPQAQREIMNSYFTRLPVYRDSLDHVVGVLHVRTVISKLAKGTLTETELLRLIRKPYYIPEGTRLTRQLLEFQERERRLGLIVDEYGDIQGLATLDDILEEIVGEFTTEPVVRSKHVSRKADGNYLVDGSANIRMLNRRLHWELPTDGPRTLNGLLLEHLQTIPDPGTGVELAGLRLTIVKVQDNVIRTVEVTADQVEPSEADDPATANLSTVTTTRKAEE